MAGFLGLGYKFAYNHQLLYEMYNIQINTKKEFCNIDIDDLKRFNDRFKAPNSLNELNDLKTIDICNFTNEELLQIPCPLLYTEYFRLLMKYDVQDIKYIITEEDEKPNFRAYISADKMLISPESIRCFSLEDKKRLDIITVLASYYNAESLTKLYEAYLFDGIYDFVSKEQTVPDIENRKNTLEFLAEKEGFNNIYELVFGLNGRTIALMIRFPTYIYSDGRFMISKTRDKNATKRPFNNSVVPMPFFYECRDSFSILNILYVGILMSYRGQRGELDYIKTCALEFYYYLSEGCNRDVSNDLARVFEVYENIEFLRKKTVQLQKELKHSRKDVN